MDSARNAVDVATRLGPFPSADEATMPVSVDADPSIAILDRYQRECERLACRMHADNPDVSIASIRELIERASDDLAESRVQSLG